MGDPSSWRGIVDQHIRSKNLEEINKLEFEANIELKKIEISARIKKAKFDALVKEGFSEIQALELCKDIS